MLWVPNLKEAVGYYTTVLGFTCNEYSEDWQWASISRDAVELMMAVPNEHTPYNGPAFTGSLYIRVENADAIWNELKDKTEIFYPIEDFEHGMREFAIKDNNGFILQFGHEIR